MYIGDTEYDYLASSSSVVIFTKYGYGTYKKKYMLYK